MIVNNLTRNELLAKVYMRVRKDGLNAGTTEEVEWAAKYLGRPYLTQRIDKGPLRYSITEI